MVLRLSENDGFFAKKKSRFTVKSTKFLSYRTHNLLLLLLQLLVLVIPVILMVILIIFAIFMVNAIGCFHGRCGPSGGR